MVNQPIGNHGLGIFCVVRFDLGPLLQGQSKTFFPNMSTASVSGCLTSDQTTE